MLPPQRNLHISEADKDSILQSGVLVLIFPSDGELYTCLIKRPGHMKIHAGQIGFPGGKLEKQDTTPQDTAIRETFEEIGIETDASMILGKLTPLYVSVSNFLIHPYLAWADAVPEFRINHNEVERILIFPVLSHLRHPRHEFRKMLTSTGYLRVPGINHDGEFIWGATAMILTEFVDVLSRAAIIQE
jgi:8-oxo-dGTP pyrophosphatase MutT (NUDIX family)